MTTSEISGVGPALLVQWHKETEVTKHDIVTEALKTAPPVSVAGATIMGASVEDWVLVLTALYLVMQVAHFLRSRYKEYKNGSL